MVHGGSLLFFFSLCTHKNYADRVTATTIRVGMRPTVRRLHPQNRGAERPATERNGSTQAELTGMRKEASTKAFLRREGVRNNQADRSDEAQSQLLSLLLFYVFDWGDDMDERGGDMVH